MRKLITAGLLASASLMATSASAAHLVFDEDGDTYTTNFDGFGSGDASQYEGLSSSLTLTLLSGIGTDMLTFSYSLTNTSSAATQPMSRVTGFGFNSDTDIESGTATGSLNNFRFDRTFPNGLGSIDACLTSGNGNNCNGGGGGGATMTTPATGEFTLSFGDDVDSLVLREFLVRYQSVGMNGQGSGSGSQIVDIPGAVPEPATWALLLLGFGFIGATMRTPRRRQEVRVRYS